MAGIGINLNALTENTSRLGARIQESFIEHTRDLAIARGPGAAYFDVSEDKIRNVRRQLETNSDREKLDALKTLIALISKGRNVSDFFPSVVKNVASSSLEIRKLVYIFLLRYAETEPDLALLSINTFQRDLADPNPLIRAMALRVLSGINVPMVGNLVILAVKKCANDPSPYVRKAAALAVIKCYSMDPGHLPSLIPIITTLVHDKSPLSIGSVAVAFQTICPTRLDLLHTHYRRLCRMLLDIDSWGQVHVLELLARYARSMLPKPSGEDIDPDLQLLLSSSEPLLMSQNPSVVMTVTRLFYYLAPPSQLSKVVGPLLRLLHLSKEVERVVLANLLIILVKHSTLFRHHYSRFFVRTTDLRETKRLKLLILLKLLSSENYQILLREFVVYAADDDVAIVSESIRAIGACANTVPESINHCLSALMDFIKHGPESSIPASVLVLKSLVQARLQTLSTEPYSLSEGHSPLRIISDLASRIDEIRHASARACIIWLVGQYADRGVDTVNPTEGNGLNGIALWAPDVLRKIAKTFPIEAPLVKLQALTLAAKLQVLSTNYHRSFALLTRYVFSLARTDSNYDVRDRARLLSGFLTGIAPHLQHTNGSMDGDGDTNDEGDAFDRGGVILRREQVKVILFEGKLEKQQEEMSKEEDDVLGSSQIITGRPTGLESSMRLPDWPEEGTDSSLRDSQEEYPSVPASSLAGHRSASDAPTRTSSQIVLTPTGRESPNLQGGTSRLGQWKSLDEFYDESDSDEEEEEEEETEDEVEQYAEGMEIPGELETTVARDEHSDISSEEEMESGEEEDESNNGEDSTREGI
ncbi:APL6 [Sanghuangporus vaninii]